VVVAAEGYPTQPQKGAAIPEGRTPEEGVVFFAGVKRDSELRVDGGRVLGVTARGRDLPEARARAYAAVPSWCFEGAQYRTDIGVGGL